MNVKQIITRHLKKNGYDGLAHIDFTGYVSCSCGIDDFCPFDQLSQNCVPAYKRVTGWRVWYTPHNDRCDKCRNAVAKEYCLMNDRCDKNGDNRNYLGRLCDACYAERLKDELIMADEKVSDSKGSQWELSSLITEKKK